MVIFEGHIHERLFILNGETRDRIVLDNGHVLKFESFLNKYLKEAMNYERVIFVDNRGVYFCDEESRKKSMEDSSENEAEDTNSKLNTNEDRFTTLNNNNTKSKKTKFRYEGLDRMERIYHDIFNWMAEEIPTVIVIYEDRLLIGDDYYNDFIADLNTTFHRLDIEKNRNIIIFTYHNVDFSKMIESRNLDFLSDENENANYGFGKYYYIGSPEKDEVINLVNRFRIMKNMNVNWENYEKIINNLTAFVKEYNKNIKSLQSLFLDKENIDRNIISGLDKDNEYRIDGITAREKFENLIGMEKLKKEVFEIADSSSYTSNSIFAGDHYNEQNELPQRFIGDQSNETEQEMIHFALQGSPGTGKTTAAKLIGRVFQESGVLEVGHTIKVTRKDLVAEYVGHSAKKTEEYLNKAMGGVLFIDEAYSLYQGENDTFGKEVIDTLVDAMSERAGKLTVIFAGYEEDIDELIDANEGFKSRVTRIKMPDYNSEELAEIFLMMSKKLGLSLSENVRENITNLTRNILINKHEYGGESFGNARVIETILTNARRKAKIRVGEKNPTLKIEDFPENIQKYFESAESETTTQEMLNDLIGLREVKDFIQKKKNRVIFERARGQDVTPGNYVFKGNPGTGKTTVAKIMANLLYEIGLINSKKLISKSAKSLIGKYLGETENEMEALLNKALGGVLFIDEAHQLYSEGRINSYGEAVIDVLVPFMENNNDDFALILAGYPEEMNRLINDSDPGLRSRISDKVIFEDFTEEELVEIFHIFADNDNYEIEEGSDDILIELFATAKEISGERFGNARTVRNLYGKVVENTAERFVNKEDEIEAIDFKIEKIDIINLIENLVKEDNDQ